MAKKDTNVVKKRHGKKEDTLRKMHMYKETAIAAMNDAAQFDRKIIEANDEYINKLKEADNTEYEILRVNMEKAETEEEREAIRNRLAEMNSQRYTKDTENKGFYEKQQESHRNHNLKILVSVAAVTGLVYKFRKPIMEAGKVLLTKN